MPPNPTASAKDALLCTLVEAGLPVRDVRSSKELLIVHAHGTRADKEIRAHVEAVFPRDRGYALYIKAVPGRNPMPMKRLEGEALEAVEKRAQQGAELVAALLGTPLRAAQDKRTGRMAAAQLADAADALRARGASRNETDALAASWGSLVVGVHGWAWMRIRGLKGDALLAPLHRYTVAPDELFGRICKKRRAGDNTAALLFDMLGGKGLPKSKKFAYTRLG